MRGGLVLVSRPTFRRIRGFTPVKNPTNATFVAPHLPRQIFLSATKQDFTVPLYRTPVRPAVRLSRKGVASQSSTNSHGRKAVQMRKCEMGFRRLHHLKIHTRRHTGAKPYPLGSCGKSFSHSANLKVHERLQTGAKPYTCSRRFRTADQLRVHHRSHAGERVVCL